MVISEITNVAKHINNATKNQTSMGKRMAWKGLGWEDEKQLMATVNKKEPKKGNLDINEILMLL